jgi:hypothetical protein
MKSTTPAIAVQAKPTVTDTIVAGINQDRFRFLCTRVPLATILSLEDCSRRHGAPQKMDEQNVQVSEARRDKSATLRWRLESR